MKQLSLSQKMSLIVAILCAGIVGVAGVGLYNLNRVGAVVSNVTDVQFKSVVEALNLKDAFHGQMIYERNYVLFYSNLEKRANNSAQIKKLDTEIRAIVTSRMQLADAAEKSSLDKFLATYNRWVDNDLEIQKIMADEDGHQKALGLISSVGRDTRLDGDKALDEILVHHQSQLELQKKQSAEAISSTFQILIWTGSAVILLGVLLAAMTLRKMSAAISNVLRNLGENAFQVNHTATQIATASQGLSQSATEQASSLEETVATIEELTAMVRINAENAASATDLAEGTRRSAEEGEKKIQGLLEAMKDIDLDSKKIQEITSVVDDLAFQTNLLALNAAVEAARAGEQGKGFAVVAEAVRTLALKSSDAAKDISNLINSSVERIQAGFERANESVESLTEIVGSVKKVSSLNSEIASATSEQSNGITQIGKAMNQLDTVTQENAAASEQAAASSQELAGQATVLNNVVEELRVAIKGSASA